MSNFESKKPRNERLKENFLNKKSYVCENYSFRVRTGKTFFPQKLYLPPC